MGVKKRVKPMSVNTFARKDFCCAEKVMIKIKGIQVSLSVS